MKIDRFEDILAWQKAKSLAVRIQNIFEKSKDFAFKSQIQRAVVSIMNNIAEGFERKSNNEFKQLLFVAKDSCCQVRSMLHLSFELKKINEIGYSELLPNSEEISKMLSGLIKNL